MAEGLVLRPASSGRTFKGTVVGLGLAMAAALAVTACRPAGEAPFFDGSLERARAEAGDRDTLVMVFFYTDWCGWCRRLEKETFTDPEVRRELDRLVAMRVDAEDEGAELAARYDVDSYPTLVFVDPAGDEVERILGYHPPTELLELLRQIRLGDTFNACLAHLEESPGDLAALERAVAGFLERSDPESAMARIEAYHASDPAHAHSACRRLMFRARAALLSRFYDRAAALYRKGWGQPLEVPATKGVRSLRALVLDGVWELPPAEQAERLREARQADARAVLAGLPQPDQLSPEVLLESGRFAVENGLYDRGAKLYAAWYERVGADAAPGDLNAAAWDLYLSRREPELALRMARAAFAAAPTPTVSDTLARILYTRGEVDEAVALEARAVVEGDESVAGRYREAADRMAGGEALADSPCFASYPGDLPKSSGPP